MTISTLRAVVILVVATVLAIVLLSLFREGDNTAIILQIVGVVAPTTVALMAYLQSSKNNEKIVEVKQDVQANTVVTEETNKMADGRLSAALDEIRGLNASVRRLETSAAVKASEASHAQSSEDRIIGAMQAAVSDAAALVPTGSTPAHGTPVEP